MNVKFDKASLLVYAYGRNGKTEFFVIKSSVVENK